LEAAANPISRLTFSFLTGLLIKGFRHSLTDNDLFELDKRDSTVFSQQKLEEKWSAEQHKEKPSISKILIRVFGPYFVISWIFHAVAVACALAQTQILNYLVTFLAIPSWNQQRNGLDGYMFALGLALLAALRSICLYQSQMISQRTAARVRVALTASVYRKSLRLSSATRTATNNGQIVNLVSNDVQRLVELFLFLNEGVFALPQIIGMKSNAGYLFF